MQADGSYVYTRDPQGNEGGEDVFTYTYVDGDGDTVSATLTIEVPQRNQGPTAAGDTINVSEEGLVPPNTTQDNAGVPDTTDDATVSGNIGASDPDGDPLTITLGVPSGSYTSNGATVNWQVSPDGQTLIGYTGGDPSNVSSHVIQVTIDDSGAYDVALLNQFDHADDTIEDSLDITIPVNVSDGEVDFPTTIVVTVEDDSPSVNAQGQVTGVVDEDDLGDGNDDVADGDDVPTNPLNGTFVSGAAGSLGALYNTGADEPLSFSLNTDTSSLEAQNLESGGEPLSYVVFDGVIYAYTGDGALNGDGVPTTGLVFTLEVSEDGSWEFNLLGQLDHAPPEGDAFENEISIDFSGMLNAEDADGDPAPALGEGAFEIVVDDDVPVLGEGNAGGAVQEDALPGGNDDSVDDTTIDTGDLSVLVDVGADDPAKFSFAGNTVATMLALGLESNNVDLKYEIVGDTLYAFTGATYEDGQVFTLQLSESGAYTFTLLDQIDHEGLLVSGTGDDQILSLDFTGIIRRDRFR